MLRLCCSSGGLFAVIILLGIGFMKHRVVGVLCACIREHARDKLLSTRDAAHASDTPSILLLQAEPSQTGRLHEPL